MGELDSESRATVVTLTLSISLETVRIVGAQAIMQVKEFTEKVADIVRRNFPDREMKVDSLVGVITLGELRFGMANLLAEYAHSPVDDDTFESKIVDRFATLLQLSGSAESVVPTSWQDAQSRLRLQLFHRRVDALDTALKFPFSADVFFSIVVDSPTGYAYVTQQLADMWEQAVVDLIEIAQQNLLDASQSMQLMLVPGPTPLAVIQTVDGYDAARVLVPEIRQRLILELTGQPEGEIYVGVPNRDFLIAWPTTLPAGMHGSICQQIAADAVDKPYPLCGKPLRVTSQTIQPL